MHPKETVPIFFLILLSVEQLSCSRLSLGMVPKTRLSYPNKLIDKLIKFHMYLDNNNRSYPCQDTYPCEMF